MDDLLNPLVAGDPSVHASFDADQHPVQPATVPVETDVQIDEVQPDETLEAAFGDEEVEVEVEDAPKVTASKKQGISHMAQPKLTASTKVNGFDIKDCWTELETPEHL